MLAQPNSGGRTLVTHEACAESSAHDRESRANVARRLAQIAGWRFGGAHEPGASYGQPAYFVPQDALPAGEAQSLGIAGPQDVFGGVVPHAFVATKAITHPLVCSDAAAPAGWSSAFPRQVADLVLRGYTAFAREDAREAARMLVAKRPVRIKRVSGIGGSGQHVAGNMEEVDAALAAIEPEEFARTGVTVEEDLAEDVTYSVGAVHFAGMSIAYCGTQRTTRNHRGHDVYGGSTLDIVRGSFAALVASDLPRDRREAVGLVRAYDAAAFAAYPDAFASRRNYDVLFGHDAQGHVRAGVLEQSWRIGGASAAEAVALAAFAADGARTRVRAATVEVYDDACGLPDGAFVHYRGNDPAVGPLTKYAVELDGKDA